MSDALDKHIHSVSVTKSSGAVLYVMHKGIALDTGIECCSFRVNFNPRP